MSVVSIVYIILVVTALTALIWWTVSSARRWNKLQKNVFTVALGTNARISIWPTEEGITLIIQDDIDRIYSEIAGKEELFHIIEDLQRVYNKLS